ncbi:hypothetical protein M0R04_07930 [Candidatus Dojkabacteria bacterium]|nr:hypothetical protein [Candidatus Dojkabacteria bacterium]
MNYNGTTESNYASTSITNQDGTTNYSDTSITNFEENSTLNLAGDIVYAVTNNTT